LPVTTARKEATKLRHMTTKKANSISNPLGLDGMRQKKHNGKNGEHAKTNRHNRKKASHKTIIETLHNHHSLNTVNGRKARTIAIAAITRRTRTGRPIKKKTIFYKILIKSRRRIKRRIINQLPLKYAITGKTAISVMRTIIMLDNARRKRASLNRNCNKQKQSKRFNHFPTPPRKRKDSLTSGSLNRKEQTGEKEHDLQDFLERLQCLTRLSPILTSGSLDCKEQRRNKEQDLQQDLERTQ
jgi:hypothetical protein